MEESTDPVTLSLMCMENSSTCFDDLECNGFADGSSSWDHKNVNFNNQCLSKDKDNNGSLEEQQQQQPFVAFLVQSENDDDETVGFLVEREREHLPRHDYLKRLRGGDLDLGVRSEALEWIWKVCLLVD